MGPYTRVLLGHHDSLVLPKRLVRLDQFFFADGFRGVAVFEGGEDVGVKPSVVRFHHSSNYGLWIHNHAGSLAKLGRR